MKSMSKCLLRTGRGQQTFSVIQAYEASFSSQWKHICQSTSTKAKICQDIQMKYISTWYGTLNPNLKAKHSDYIRSIGKKYNLNSDEWIVLRYLLCGGGTLFCLILGLETSVSCSICGTWEAILSESLSDTITDGSVETASEGASSGYLKNRKKVSRSSLSHTTVKHSYIVLFWHYT